MDPSTDHGTPIVLLFTSACKYLLVEVLTSSEINPNVDRVIYVNLKEEMYPSLKAS